MRMTKLLAIFFSCLCIQACGGGTTLRVDNKPGESGERSLTTDRPCGDAPKNWKSAESAKLKAAVDAAVNSSTVADPEAKVTFENEFQKSLESQVASSDLANDIALISHSVCWQCLSLGLKADECDRVRTEAVDSYKELVAKK